MKLIAGLGNPGDKYQATRHNLGFMVVDKLALKLGAVGWQAFSTQSQICSLHLDKQQVILLKPQTFMNESGKSVLEIANFYKIPPGDLWVVHDDLDLAYTVIKLDDGASAAGHRGVQSLIDTLGTQAFKRFRLGLGRPEPNKPPEDFVLEPFSATEARKLEAFIDAAGEIIISALKQDFAQAQASHGAWRPRPPA